MRSPTLNFALTLLGALASVATRVAFGQGATPQRFANAYLVAEDRGQREPLSYFQRLDWVQITRDLAAPEVPPSLSLDIEVMAERPFAVAWLSHGEMLMRTGPQWVLLDPALSDTASPARGFGPGAADVVADRAATAAAPRRGADLARPLRPPRPGRPVITFHDLGAKRDFGVHWGTFQLGDEEPIDAARDLAAALARSGTMGFGLLSVGGFGDASGTRQRCPQRGALAGDQIPDTAAATPTTRAAASAPPRLAGTPVRAVLDHENERLGDGHRDRDTDAVANDSR